MTVSYEALQTATAILTRIAFSGGQEADPTVTLAVWRQKEGFDEQALEQAARESAQGSIEEIEQLIADGESLSLDGLREYLEREYLTALQIGWIARARHDAAAAKVTNAG